MVNFVLTRRNSQTWMIILYRFFIFIGTNILLLFIVVKFDRLILIFFKLNCLDFAQIISRHTLCIVLFCVWLKYIQSKTEKALLLRTISRLGGTRKGDINKAYKYQKFSQQLNPSVKGKRNTEITIPRKFSDHPKLGKF